MHGETNVPYVERRQAPRYRVALPVDLEPGSGQTRDLSVSGVFFETDRPFLPGTFIRFSVGFGSGLRVRCEGRVVRVEPGEGKVGVAVAFTSYGFEPADQPLGPD